MPDPRLPFFVFSFPGGEFESLLHRIVASAAPVPVFHPPSEIPDFPHLSNELNNTTGSLDLLLSIPAEVASADDDGDLGETALAENLGVAEGKEVDDGGGVGLLAAQVGITLLGGDERPQLYWEDNLSAIHILENVFQSRMFLRSCSIPSPILLPRYLITNAHPLRLLIFPKSLRHISIGIVVSSFNVPCQG